MPHIMSKMSQLQIPWCVFLALMIPCAQFAPQIHLLVQAVKNLLVYLEVYACVILDSIEETINVLLAKLDVFHVLLRMCVEVV